MIVFRSTGLGAPFPYPKDGTRVLLINVMDNETQSDIFSFFTKFLVQKTLIYSFHFFLVKHYLFNISVLISDKIKQLQDIINDATKLLDSDNVIDVVNNTPETVQQLNGKSL